jgi:hypothetical protein
MSEDLVADIQQLAGCDEKTAMAIVQRVVDQVTAQYEHTVEFTDGEQTYTTLEEVPLEALVASRASARAVFHTGWSTIEYIDNGKKE